MPEYRAGITMLKNSKWLSFSTGELLPKSSMHGNPSPYFRKTFSVKKEVKAAELLITSLGIFKAYINGIEIDNDMLLPGWTDYSKRIPVIKYDIAPMLARDNAIGVVLGDGWYCGYLFLAGQSRIYGDCPQLIAEINIFYADGSSETIVTDEHWRASSGEIRSNSFYLGETIDRTMSAGDFSAFGYDDSLWCKPSAVCNSSQHLLEPAVAENTKLNLELIPELIFSDGTRLIYDFKQNFAGIVTADIEGERGSKVVFRHGEMLSSPQEIYVANLRAAVSTDTFICAGGKKEHFKPLFTYHGFRYVEITKAAGTKVTEVKGQVLFNALERTGKLKTSSALVDRIYENALWSQLSNFVSVPTDCPQRDERLGWTGDAQIFAKTAMYNMDCRRFFSKYLTDIRDAQKDNGSTTIIAPSMGLSGFEGRAAWGDAVTVIPYEHYIMYGDIDILRSNIDAAKRWVQYCLAHSDGFIRPDEGYGDWLNIDEYTDKSLISTAYFAHSAFLTARMCEYLDDKKGMLYHDRLFSKIRAAYNKAFVGTAEKNFILSSDTLTAYLLSYSFGLVSGKDCLYHIRKLLEAKNCHVTCGFVGIRFVLPTLCDMGMKQFAYRLITNQTFPSWGYSVLNGATTMWERWDSYTKEKGFSDTGMNSFNHYCFGSCVEWMYKYMLGIAPDTDKDGVGFKKVRIKPYIDDTGKITSAKGTYKSVRGDISVSWQIEKNNEALLVVSADEGIETVMSLNDYFIIEQRHTVNAHTYRLKLTSR